MEMDLKRRFDKVMVQPAHVPQLARLISRFQRGVVWLLLACAIPGAAIAQQATDSPALPTEFTDPDSVTDETQRVLLRTVRSADPQTPEAIVRYASALINAELYLDARLLLSRLAALNLSDDQAQQLIDRLGSDLFLQSSLIPELQPEGRQVANSILTSATRATRTPARIQASIRNLSATDASARRIALGQLEQAGESSVAELLNVFADSNRKSEYPAVRQALAQLGESYFQPIVGATRAKQARVKVEAIRALTRIRNESSTDVLMWSYLAPQHPIELQQMSLQALIERGIQPDANLIEQRFFRRAFQYVNGNVARPVSLDRSVKIWHWSEQRNQMAAGEVDPQTASRVIAARHAANLYEVNPASLRNRAIYLLTQLERAKRLATPARSINVDAVVAGLNTNVQEINVVLSQAVRLELYPAAIACCEIISQHGKPELLYRNNGEPSALIEAITSGDRYLQFAAFQAIDRLDPGRAYVGSSFVLSFAVYLAQSRNVPIAAVAHPEADLAQTFAAAISNQGIVGQPAVSSRGLFDLATSNPDVEMVLVSDKIGRPGFRSLIDQLRNDWRTRRMPIAMLYHDMDRGHQISRELDRDELFIAVPYTNNAELIATNVDRLIQRIEPYRLTRPSRFGQAKSALNWLVKVSSDRQRYNFYELAQYHEQLAELLFVPGFEVPATKILAQLPTATVQRQLINFAGQTQLPMEQRKQAASAFAQAVKRGGTMLTNDEIRAQFQRYQAASQTPNEEVYGTIMQAIQSQR